MVKCGRTSAPNAVSSKFSGLLVLKTNDFECYTLYGPGKHIGLVAYIIFKVVICGKFINLNKIIKI